MEGLTFYGLYRTLEFRRVGTSMLKDFLDIEGMQCDKWGSYCVKWGFYYQGAQGDAL